MSSFFGDTLVKDAQNMLRRLSAELNNSTDYERKEWEKELSTIRREYEAADDK